MGRKLKAPKTIEGERRACAKIADDMADDLMERHAEGFHEKITTQQVVNGYRMIAKIIRARTERIKG